MYLKSISTTDNKILSEFVYKKYDTHHIIKLYKNLYIKLWHLKESKIITEFVYKNYDT